MFSGQSQRSRSEEIRCDMFVISRIGCHCTGAPSVRVVGGTYYCKRCGRPLGIEILSPGFGDMAGLSRFVSDGSGGNVRAENDALRSRVSELEASLAFVSDERENTVSRLNGRISELSRSVSDLESRLRDSEEGAKALTSDNADLEDSLRHVRAELGRMRSVDVRGIIEKFLCVAAEAENAAWDRDDPESIRRSISMQLDRLCLGLPAHGITVSRHRRGDPVGEGRLDAIFEGTSEPPRDMTVACTDRFGCSFEGGVYADIPENVTVYRYTGVPSFPQSDSTVTEAGSDERGLPHRDSPLGRDLPGQGLRDEGLRGGVLQAQPSGRDRWRRDPEHERHLRSGLALHRHQPRQRAVREDGLLRRPGVQGRVRPREDRRPGDGGGVGMMSWRMSTAVILLTMAVTYAAVGAVLGYVFTFWFAEDGWLYGAGLFLAISLALCVYSYLSPVPAVMRAYNAREVRWSEEPRLFETVSDLCAEARIPMPKVYVCDVGFPNAFALGRTPERACVAVTRPLLDMLPDDELKGIMGHELSHIIHRDTIVNGTARNGARFLTVSAFVMGAIGSLAMAFLGAKGGKSSGGGGILFLLIFVILVPVIIACLVMSLAIPSAAAVMRFGVSRSREFGADESSARLTGDPMALARALTRIDGSCARSDNGFRDHSSSSLWIVNPCGRFRGRFLDGLMDTHPSTEERVRRLEALDAEINGRSRRLQA